MASRPAVLPLELPRSRRWKPAAQGQKWAQENPALISRPSAFPGVI